MQEDHKFEASQGKVSETLAEKNKSKRAGGVAQEIEHLPCMHKALVQSPVPWGWGGVDPTTPVYYIVSLQCWYLPNPHLLTT
jgi:hypothetical protein